MIVLNSGQGTIGPTEGSFQGCAMLGTSGMRISWVALGTAAFGVAPSETDADAVIGGALEAGINAIDIANAYGNLASLDREGVPPASQRRSAGEIIGASHRER